jgi:hypothetical protein
MAYSILPLANIKRNPIWEVTRQKQAVSNSGLDEPIWSFRPDFGSALSGPGVDVMFDTLFPLVGNRAKRGQCQALMSALLALAQAVHYSQLKGVTCGFLHERSTSRTGTPRRYKVCDFSTTQFTKALDALVNLDFVECWKGFKGEHSVRGVASLWLPSESFGLWLNENFKSIDVVSLSQSHETIILKDDNKRLQDYDDDDAVKAMRERVEAGNSLRSCFSWSYVPMISAQSYLEGDKRHGILSGSLRCYRVFNGDFQSGGRFYCGVQGLRQSERATITVDGKPTVELDYKSLHPRLIYNVEGIEAPEDCYASAKRPRALTKLVSLLSINCTSFSQAHRALMRETKLSSDEAREHLKSYSEEHSIISHRFFAAGWKRLQYLDSQIVDAVLTKTAARLIPILPIHDSFVIPTEHAHWVMDVAAESYSELTGFSTVIDWEPMPDVQHILDKWPDLSGF